MSSVMDFLFRLPARKYADSRVSFPSPSFIHGGPQPRVSSPLRPLNLDDFSAQVGQIVRGEGGRQDARQVDTPSGKTVLTRNTSQSMIHY